MQTRGKTVRAVCVVAGLTMVLAACSSSVNTAGGAGSTTAPGATVAGSTAVVAPGTTAPLGTAVHAAKPSAGCGTSATRAVDKEKRTLTVDGADRYYLLTTPAAHDGTTPLPLVLDFHGLAEGAEVHTAMSGFGELAKKDGFVVAGPNGSGNPVHWDASLKSSPNQDLDFVDQLLVSLGHDLCIDESRVYATGLSYGAIWSSFLTCTRADRFAAVAPVAGITITSGCAPDRIMPVITFHGTADPILTFNGGVGSALSSIMGKTPATEAGATTTTTAPADINGAGYPATTAAWAKRNGCQDAPVDTKVSDAVIHRVYDCPAGAAVEFYIVLGGGHAWPGSEFSKSIAKVVGPTTMDIDATALIWEFFQRFQLPA